MSSRLTSPEDWLWEDWTPGTTESVRKQAARKWWYVRRLKESIPANARTFIELGCAPGDISAQLIVDTALEPYGVDFSPNADRYLEAMHAIGKTGTLYKEDLFDFDPRRTFDVVASFGLIEHFQDLALDQILALHDSLLSPGGTILISLPNFKGVPYLWHRLVDVPNLEKHNLETMNLDIFGYFTERGYEVVVREYWGVLRVWGVSSFSTGLARSLMKYPLGAGGLSINAASRGISRLGIHLSGPHLSPFIVFAARKPMET